MKSGCRSPVASLNPPLGDGFNRQPTTDNRQPTTGNRQPATDNRQPTTLTMAIPSTPESDALLLAQAEIVELTQSISTLRQQIEQILGEKQQTAASSQAQVTHL